MESVVNLVKSSDDPAKLLVQLNQAFASPAQHSPAALSQALTALDAAQHSLGYLFILDARFGHAPATEPDEAYVELAANFCRVCSEQIRESPERFVNVCRRLKEDCMLLHNPRRALSPLLTAVSKLTANPELITPLHAEVFQACMLSKCYGAALPLLTGDVLDVDPKRTALTVRNYQLYCYYGGMIHTGLRKYAEALGFFLYGLTAPTMVVNAITMASYRKCILVSLIHRGAFHGLPKYTPGIVTRSGKSECAAYIELATAYGKGPEELQKALNSHQEAFSNDGNTGLVKLALAARTKRAIQKLTQTYLTLSLADIARQVGLPSAADAEAHILRMIDAGEVFAQIDQAAGMVRFLDDPEHYDAASVVSRIDAQIQASISVGERVKKLNQRVATDRAYLNRVGGGGGGKGRHERFEDPGDFGAEQMAYSFNA